jgi:hypothetical protein
VPHDHARTQGCALARRAQHDTNVVVVSIPRSCLSKPRRVKVAAMAGDEVKATTPTDGSAPVTTDTSYFDDAQNSEFGSNETWSPRLHKVDAARAFRTAVEAVHPDPSAVPAGSRCGGGKLPRFRYAVDCIWLTPLGGSR